MKIHHIRNATFSIEIDNQFILVDPMMGPKGSSAPFTLFRFKPRKNPTVNLPSNAKEIFEKTTHCIVTHLHPDHLDKVAINFLKERNIPVVCNTLDKPKLYKAGLKNLQGVEYWNTSFFLEGDITGIPAKHGYGFIANPMGTVIGYHINFKNGKSVYISADTIYTPDVHRVLTEYNPQVSVLAAGKAQLDLGQPLLMHQEDMVKFVKNSPNKVFANHMESLNHCPHTRADLKALLTQHQLLDKVSIPEDGETINF